MNSPILIWNVRGIGNKATIRSLANYIQEFDVSIAAISEPRVPLARAHSVARKIQLPLFIGNNGELSKIWLFYNSKVTLEVIESHPQFLTVAYKELNEVTFYFTVVYASCSVSDRREMFDALIATSEHRMAPWVIGGDFNCILSPEEKMGGILSSGTSMIDFHGFMSAVGLSDAGFSGPKFTWTNKQTGQSHIQARLDRVLVNTQWLNSEMSMTVKHLSRGPSDHSPLLLSKPPSVLAPGRFLYQQMWHTHQDFLDFVKGNWNSNSSRDIHPFYALQKKLKDLKVALRIWNREVFGDLNQAKKEVTALVAEREICFDENPTQDNRILLQQANARMFSILEREEIFWYQKSRINWMNYGDRNTSFFHQYAKVRRQQNFVRRLLLNGNWVEDQESLHDGAIQYFQNLLTSEVNSLDPDLISVIPQMITADQNDSLCVIPQSAEVKEAVFSLSGNSSPGPDGFSGIFYTHCWEVIEEDVVKAVQSFFQGWGLPKGVTSSILCLIPKVKSPSSYADFRPISLCNFSYKIVAKVVSDRLRKLLPIIISKEQSGFVRGRQIIDCFSLAKEMLHELDRPVRGHNIFLKLDMTKAYDRVEWNFLLAVLRQFGFSSRFTSLVAQMISNCWFSISFNGISKGFFKSSRGIRQGDPLAPALFIIAEEVLSRGLSQIFRSNHCQYFHLPRGAVKISHLLFADDVIIFMNGGLSSLRNLKLFLSRYEACSGQQVNVQKSCFMASKKMPRSSIRNISHLTGFSHKTGSILYLGIPLFYGREKVSHFKYLIDKVAAKLEGWQSKILSQAGRLILIKSVLNSITLYSASAASIPVSIYKRIGSLCSNFFWQGTDSAHRRHWVSWDAICKPLEMGGLGIRNQVSLQLCLIVKRLWQACYSDSLWAIFMRRKYLHGTHISTCTKPFPAGVRRSIFEKARGILIAHSRKIVFSGSSTDFLYDTWIHSHPLADYITVQFPQDQNHFSVRDVMNDSTHKFWQLHFSPQLLQSIRAFPLREGDDRPVWTLSNSGEFSTKTVYKTLMVSSQGGDDYLKKLWHPKISPRASLFCWKLLKHAVPVDQQIQRCGVNLASSCVCCSTAHSVEDEFHLFFGSELAGYYWSALSRVLSISRLDTHQVSCSLQSLLRENDISHPIGFVNLYGVILAIWDIWRVRCKAKLEGTKSNLRLHVSQLIESLQSAVSAMKFKVEVSRECRQKFQAVGLHINCLKFAFTVVRWQPAEDYITLNVDGSCKGNPGLSGGGGCFRNYHGHVILGFSFFYGSSTNMTAEGRALLDGLRIAKLNNYRLSVIYSDSLSLVLLLTMKADPPPWLLLPWWGEIQSLLQALNCPIKHTYREGNQLADALANHAVRIQRNEKFFSLKELPSLARGYAIADAIGLPNFRRRVV